VPLHRDVIAGTLFVLIGAAALVLGRRYPAGTAMHMGPGYFPAVLGMVLIVLGASIGLRAFRRAGWTPIGWGWKPLAWIVAAMLAFGFLMPRVGLIPALAVMLPVAAAAGREFVLREVVLLTVLMCLFAVGVFVYALKLPYPMFAF
jgi:hypothetical protein